MADVRSLLRSERTARRISHAQAVYTASGTLTCTACRVSIKTESLWEVHLTSSAHVSRARQQAAIAGETAPESRKRKASPQDAESDQTKRPKAGLPVPGLPQDFFDGASPLADPTLSDDAETATRPASAEMASHPKRSTQTTVPTASTIIPSDFFDTAPVRITTTVSRQLAADAIAAETVDEDEYAAFEREVAAAEAASEASAANATITAAPITAAELAARAVAEANTQKKEQADLDLMNEQEDAVRRVEEEIDEMEELEQRIRRLRDRREEIRQTARSTGEGGGSADTIAREQASSPDRHSKKEGNIDQGVDMDDDDDDEDEDADLEDWSFRAR